ncbi:MAG: hypothetical protein ACUVXA_06800 [Candidatus Jordarchaeum sp.]|uniref:hypothetical protein n=1 Tax=Candidatus Jordarchaeum sp. TaxID=2823881 RepID=UPI00404A6418
MESVNELAKLLEEIVKDEIIKGLVLISKEGKSESMVILEESVNKDKLAASSATLLSISSQAIEKLLNQTPEYILSFTQNNLIITLPVNSSMVLSALIERKKAEYTGIENCINKIKKVSEKVALIVEMSEYPKKGLFMNIRNALPEAKTIAILTNEGVPLMVHPAEDAITISGMISAIHTIGGNMVPNEDSDYSVIAGKEGLIIAQQIDNNRLLAVAIPKKVKINDIVAKIKMAVKESETQSVDMEGSA